MSLIWNSGRQTFQKSPNPSKAVKPRNKVIDFDAPTDGVGKTRAKKRRRRREFD